MAKLRIVLSLDTFNCKNTISFSSENKEVSLYVDDFLRNSAMVSIAISASFLNTGIKISSELIEKEAKQKLSTAAAPQQETKKRRS